MNENIIAFEDQIILVNSKWTDTRGNTSEFMFPVTDEGGHPMRNFEKGARFHVVMIEIQDDEEPIDQKTKKKLHEELKRKNIGGKQSNDCGMMCRTRDFHRYLVATGEIMKHWDETTRNKMARQYVIDKLRIKSRAEIDHSKENIAAYHNLICKPFYDWAREHPGKPQ